jgi:hypothetical protein
MEVRLAGMAPTPERLEKIMQAVGRETEKLDAEPESGNVPEYEIRTEDFPDGVYTGITATLRTEVTQIIYSTHWEYQKRVLDHVEAVIASDRQWAIVRRILMGIMTEQMEKTRLLVGQRIRQETFEIQETVKEG